MKRRSKIIALTLSHVAVFSIGAAWFAGYRIRSAFEAATGDPLYRIGLAMELPPDENVMRSLDADFSALSKTVPPPTADVVRFVALLEHGRLEHAGAACRGLAWPRCDLETLKDMKKVLKP